ncbi:hypothetical protein [Sediminibacillus massiliensis]|uniref:hypothetical protein n=1 Tax=Sediminibacillus massiliensis TaxID=1926277 RepID=UPI0009885E16|nr:hypothetical protein [Sediminibacillus massiliensis]
MKVPVREWDKRKFVRECRRKEADGYECVRGMKTIYVYHKRFKQYKNSYEFQEKEEDAYYEAIYEKKEMEK